MEPELIGGWIVSLVTLALFYWRSNKKAIADQAALEQRLTNKITTLTKKSQATEQGLRTELISTKSQLQTSEVNKAKLAAEIIALNQQCQRLREELKTQAAQVQTDAIAGGFEQIQTLLTQYPSVQCMVASQPELPARNIIALLTSLENLVKYWGCSSIGKPWEKVSYDPQIHQSDVDDVQPGEEVYVRFIGYQQGDKILIPAKVSRTLPTGAKP
jgi:molecular chaperone GrpE (heat shock protein)